VVRAGSDTDHIMVTVIVHFIDPLDAPPKYPGDIFVHCHRNRASVVMTGLVPVIHVVVYDHGPWI